MMRSTTFSIFGFFLLSSSFNHPFLVPCSAKQEDIIFTKRQLFKYNNANINNNKAAGGGDWSTLSLSSSLSSSKLQKTTKTSSSTNDLCLEAELLDFEGTIEQNKENSGKGLLVHGSTTTASDATSSSEIEEEGQRIHKIKNQHYNNIINSCMSKNTTTTTSPKVWYKVYGTGNIMMATICNDIRTTTTTTTVSASISAHLFQTAVFGSISSSSSSTQDNKENNDDVDDYDDCHSLTCIDSSTMIFNDNDVSTTAATTRVTTYSSSNGGSTANVHSGIGYHDILSEQNYCYDQPASSIVVWKSDKDVLYHIVVYPATATAASVPPPPAADASAPVDGTMALGKSSNGIVSLGGNFAMEIQDILFTSDTTRNNDDNDQGYIIVNEKKQEEKEEANVNNDKEGMPASKLTFTSKTNKDDDDGDDDSSNATVDEHQWEAGSMIIDDVNEPKIETKEPLSSDHQQKYSGSSDTSSSSIDSNDHDHDNNHDNATVIMNGKYNNNNSNNNNNNNDIEGSMRLIGFMILYFITIAIIMLIITLFYTRYISNDRWRALFVSNSSSKKSTLVGKEITVISLPMDSNDDDVNIPQQQDTGVFMYLQEINMDSYDNDDDGSFHEFV